VTGAATTVVATAGTLGALSSAEVVGAEASVTLADSIAQGTVNAGGGLAKVLGAIEEGYAATAPTTALEALGVVNAATESVGLSVGYASVASDLSITLLNRGGIITALGLDGSITVLRELGPVLLRLR